MSKTLPGVSGMAVYLPELEVRLSDWCEWTGSNWSKVRAVVGESFRRPAPHENAYTMAANAALRLIRAYDVDPRDIGMLALGTESSTDNSAGAVIVRGMLDRALDRLGMPRLSRRCEVPELKHACLGGMYALKGALRYVATDGIGRKAIVICADIAEYERGSSGEQTQGAGAVAMLVEAEPKLFEVDLARAGSASDYRGPDFRKPIARYFAPGYAEKVERLHDFPIFSGRYSTYAYLEETVRAFESLVDAEHTSPLELFERARAFFFHRPYAHMPISALAFLWVRAVAASRPEDPSLATWCAEAEVSVDEMRDELSARPDLYADVLDGETRDPFPITNAVASKARRSEDFRQLVAAKLALGDGATRRFGNLYTAALPAWLAAGFEDALEQDVELFGAPLYAIGYGSGDAAEAWPLRAVEGWREAARKIGVADALDGSRAIDREQYEALHDHGTAAGLGEPPRDRFVITHVGERYDDAFQDLGVEYYDYAE
ncbi:MAG TPA: hydroxymethylglutaryl-CoA synthase [Polyangiaceae bacterium]|nr:hydroxymethylglutaryl-CoA synthase [Polyangiaceae bacterium]